MDAGLAFGLRTHTDGLARALAGAGVGLGALAADRQAAQVPDAAVALDALQALQVHADFAAQIAFDHILAVLNGVPERLISRLLVKPQSASEDGFLFTHALIRDVIYDTLLRSRRRELHRRAAQWYADRDPVLHAEHLDRAEDPRAAQAYLAAARSQVSEYRQEDALQLVEQGLALASDRSDCFSLMCLKGEILHDLGSMSERAALIKRRSMRLLMIGAVAQRGLGSPR